MGWETSTRKSRLPKDWPRRVAHVLRRDPICQWPGCEQPSTECDHKIRGDDHSSANLQGLCTPHHARKSALEGVAARPSRRRPAEPHPGLIA